MKISLMLLILLHSLIVFSQIQNDEKENLIRQRVKLRAYPGGFEEEPLRVQPQINPATRKMAPVQELIEESSSTAGDQAHD